ncbi:MAG: thermonuclease family protein [Desulfovibrio sp.]|nr:thermonuclease family protein [Desulfovibrio sp.]
MLPAIVLAHGGGLDSYGCHNDRKRGGYHCHRGPLAGQSFDSQADMLAALNAQNARQEQSSPPRQQTQKKQPAQAQKSISGAVLRVSDGDTISVRVEGREITVRLYGVDCPEKKQEYGPEAQEFVEDLLLTDTVELIPVDQDRYGRVVAIVKTKDGVALEEKLLTAGLAWLYPQYCKRAECAGWKKLEMQARESRQGLWQGKAMPPWEWRKRK